MTQLNCPKCWRKMQRSNLVVDTYPETIEWYCECGLIWDERDCALTQCYRTNEVKVAEKRERNDLYRTQSRRI